MAFDLILYIIVVINAIESIWKRVNALVPGVRNVVERKSLYSKSARQAFNFVRRILSLPTSKTGFVEGESERILINEAVT